MARRPSLARDIAVVLVAKALALAALYWLFFERDARLPLTPETVRSHVAPAGAAR